MRDQGADKFLPAEGSLPGWWTAAFSLPARVGFPW